MIGSMSSSLALAQRTASQARATMDSMSRQIATGQRVSSVKDDGATWARVADARSQQVDWAVRRQTLDRVELGLKHTDAAIQRTYDTLNQLKDLVLAARAHPAGSDSRRNLQAAWAEAVQSSATPDDVNPGFEGAAGYAVDALGIGYQLSTTDPFFSGTRFAAFRDLQTWGDWFTAPANAGQGRPAQLSAVNLSTASTAQLDDAMTTINTYGGWSGVGWASAWAIHNGSDQRQVENLKVFADEHYDRLDTAIGSLTDADLGKVSAQRAQAETRQQLALDTVRTAISAYGNFANGLLDNVQRTQRGVMA